MQSEGHVIRLLLVDDHPVVRKGTRELLDATRDLSVVGEVGSGEEAILQTRLLDPDVILMDVSMPGMNGIEATRRIKAERPQQSVLVLTNYEYDADVFARLEAGAACYLLKNASGEELMGAVRAVAAGESALHPSVARKVLARFSAGAGSGPEGETLSPRELEVLRV
ncbi:MAG: response regulator, partial [Deinococcus sp.]